MVFSQARRAATDVSAGQSPARGKLLKRVSQVRILPGAQREGPAQEGFPPGLALRRVRGRATCVPLRPLGSPSERKRCPLLRDKGGVPMRHLVDLQVREEQGETVRVGLDADLMEVDPNGLRPTACRFRPRKDLRPRVQGVPLHTPDVCRDSPKCTGLGSPPGEAVAQRSSRAVSKIARTPVRIRPVSPVPTSLLGRSARTRRSRRIDGSADGNDCGPQRHRAAPAR